MKDQVDWEGLKALSDLRRETIAGKSLAETDIYIKACFDYQRALDEAFPAILAAHEADQRVIDAAKKLVCRTNNLVKSAKHYRDAVNTTWKSQNPDECDWLVDEEKLDEDEALSRQGDAYSALTSGEYDCEKALAEFDKAKP